MLNQARNVSRKFSNSHFAPLRLSIGSSNGFFTRRSSTLSNTNRYRPIQTITTLNQPSKQQIPPSCIRGNFYSTNSDQPPNDGEKKYERALPKLSDAPLQVVAPFLSFIPINLKAWKIRSTLDSEFSLAEFVEGSVKAVEVNIR